MLRCVDATTTLSTTVMFFILCPLRQLEERWVLKQPWKHGVKSFAETLEVFKDQESQSQWSHTTEMFMTLPYVQDHFNTAQQQIPTLTPDFCLHLDSVQQVAN